MAGLWCVHGMVLVFNGKCSCHTQRVWMQNRIFVWLILFLNFRTCVFAQLCPIGISPRLTRLILGDLCVCVCVCLWKLKFILSQSQDEIGLINFYWCVYDTFSLYHHKTYAPYIFIRWERNCLRWTQTHTGKLGIDANILYFIHVFGKYSENTHCIYTHISTVCCVIVQLMVFCKIKQIGKFKNIYSSTIFLIFFHFLRVLCMYFD